MEIGGPRRRRRRRRGGGGGGGGPGGGQGQQPPQGQQGNPQGQGAQGGQYQSQGQFQGQGQSQGQSQGQGQFQGQGQPPQGQRAPQQQPRYPQNNGQNQGQNQGQFQGNGQHQGQHQGHHQGHGGNGQQARANQAAQNNQRHMKAGGLPPLPDGVKPWADLTVIDPQPRITLEYAGCPASCRLIDLFCPIGRGQRSLIVSPPKAGKTTLLKDIALAVLRNHPGIELVVLLIDERPEEVTDFRRTLAGYEERLAADLAWAQNAAKDLGMHVDQVASDPSRTQAIVGGFGAQIVSPRCKIIASSNDHGTDQHVSVAMKAAEYCKRQVELGKHVVMLLDSLTRLGRAFNQSRKHASSGRIMTGGLDSKALEVPRQIFGSARNTEEAGSLTIIASCLVDTGSAADQIIFEEFKGSGNMELILDRKIAERRLFPAINLAESGTRKEELLVPKDQLRKIYVLRRILNPMGTMDAIEFLIDKLRQTKTNSDFFNSMNT